MQWIDSLVDHWVIEARNVDPTLLSDLDRVKRRVRRVVKHLGLTLVATRGHHFGPGCTVIALLSESHLSIHTWPEHRYFYADVATCGPALNRDEIGAIFGAVFNTDFLQIRRHGK